MDISGLPSPLCALVFLRSGFQKVQRGVRGSFRKTPEFLSDIEKSVRRSSPSTITRRHCSFSYGTSFFMVLKSNLTETFGPQPLCSPVGFCPSPLREIQHESSSTTANSGLCVLANGGYKFTNYTDAIISYKAMDGPAKAVIHQLASKVCKGFPKDIKFRMS